MRRYPGSGHQCRSPIGLNNHMKTSNGTLSWASRHRPHRWTTVTSLPLPGPSYPFLFPWRNLVDPHVCGFLSWLWFVPFHRPLQYLFQGEKCFQIRVIFLLFKPIVNLPGVLKVGRGRDAGACSSLSAFWYEKYGRNDSWQRFYHRFRNLSF